MTDPAPDAASGGDGAANARGSSWRDKVATETQEIALAQVTAPDAAAGEQGADDMKSKGKNLLAGALSTPSTRGSSWRDKFAAKTKEITLARVTAVDGAKMPDVSTAMQATPRNEKQVQARKLAAQLQRIEQENSESVAEAEALRDKQKVEITTLRAEHDRRLVARDRGEAADVLTTENHILQGNIAGLMQERMEVLQLLHGGAVGRVNTSEQFSLDKTWAPLLKLLTSQSELETTNSELAQQMNMLQLLLGDMQSSIKPP